MDVKLPKLGEGADSGVVVNVFVKEGDTVAKDQPVLRTLYVKWPWPHFYELPRSVGMVAIARVEDGEDCVLPQKVGTADAMTLTEVDALISHATSGNDKAAPMREPLSKMLEANARSLRGNQFAVTLAQDG